MTVLDFLTHLQLLYYSAAALWILFCYFTYQRVHGNLHKIPGPWLNSLSSLPRVLSVLSGKSHHHDVDLHMVYGPLVRIAPNSLSLSDPTEIETVYGVSSRFYKSRFFDSIEFEDNEGIVPDPFTMKDKAMHNRMKRGAANAYSLNALVKLEPLVEKVVDRLMGILEEACARPGGRCDLGRYLHHFAMDAVLAITFGDDLRFMENGDDASMLKSMHDYMVYFAVVGQVPRMHKALAGNKLLAKLINSDSAFVERVMAISTAKTAENLRDLAENPHAPCTFLRRLLLNQQQNPKSLTEREVSAHTFGNITAGGDTTAIALRSIIIHLLNHPQAYIRLCREIREERKLRRPVQYSAASKLPYLSAVIKEAMRLHPSIAMMLPRTIPAGGAVICGYGIPAGTEIGINPWVIHRDPLVFPEPESFKPERWLTTDPQHLSRMNRSFFAFGSGAHTCSGRHISWLEVHKLIPTLLLTFDIQFANKEDTTSHTNYWLSTQTGLVVSLTRYE